MSQMFYPVEGAFLTSFTKICIALLAICGVSACSGSNSTADQTPPPIVNLAPAVSISGGLAVVENDPVSLVATAQDTDGTITRYKWTQTDGMNVSFSGEDTDTIVFDAPELPTPGGSVIELVFNIEVTDNQGATANANATVSVSRSSGAGQDAGVIPLIETIDDQFLPPNSSLLRVQPQLSNQSEVGQGRVHWSKTYGPDCALVNPLTGEVSWEIGADTPIESFYIGVRAASPAGHSTENFIVHIGKSTSSEIVYVGEDEAIKTIASGLEALPSGGTLVVRNGTYSGTENYIGLTPRGAYQQPRSGNASALTTVMAEDPGQVVLEDNAYISLRSASSDSISFAAFKGFFVNDGQVACFASESHARPHHIKFTHNGANGYDPSDSPGNSSKPAGRLNPFSAFRCDDVLFENNYAFGSGRYKFTSYLANRVVWRRNVARYDRGTFNGEPKGTYSVYTTMDGYLANNIAIDSDDYRFTTTGEVAGEYATPTTAGNTRARMDRNIQLNSEFMLGNFDDQAGVSDVEVSDLVSWDIRPQTSVYLRSWGASLIEHATMGDVNPAERSVALFNSYHDKARGIRNSVLHNFQNGDLFYRYREDPNFIAIDRVAPRYGVDTINLTQSDGERDALNSGSVIKNVSSIPPLYSGGNPSGGLRYLVRVETGSSLAGQGKDGGDLGATVMTFKGRSGTFFGEPGYDEETNIPMWPFPMQDIIKEKFAAYRYFGPTYSGPSLDRVQSGTGELIGARGFAVPDQTLTNYIWGYLGNLVPPMGVSFTPGAAASEGVIQWRKSVDPDVTGYKVYRTDRNGQLLELLETLDGQIMSYQVSNLESDRDYFWGVTALKAGEESGVSYIAALER